MGLREDFQKRVVKKEQEIAGLETQIREARIYIQALQDSMKLLPRTDAVSGQSSLRPNSSLYKAHEALRNAGKPLHITNLLQAMGRSTEKASRLSLASSIAAYVRRGEIFTRPAPNTFGLVELEAREEVSEVSAGNGGEQ